MLDSLSILDICGGNSFFGVVHKRINIFGFVGKLFDADS